MNGWYLIGVLAVSGLARLVLGAPTYGVPWSVQGPDGGPVTVWNSGDSIGGRDGGSITPVEITGVGLGTSTSPLVIGPSGTTTRETVACGGGVSPCYVDGGLCPVLSAASDRTSACVCNNGSTVTVLRAGLNPDGGAYDKALYPGSATGDGLGQCWCTGGPTAWRGTVAVFGGDSVSAWGQR